MAVSTAYLEQPMQKLSLNLGDDDLDAIDAVASQFVMARRHAVARAALRAGIDQMRRDRSFAQEHLMREVTQSQGRGK